LEIGVQQTNGVNTRHLRADEPGAIEAAAESILKGHLVIFPTDTVYGVGADPFNTKALTRLYQVKKRPIEKGIPILLADLDDLVKVTCEIPPSAAVLITHHWPGPLTIIVPKHSDLPAIISPNDGIAVRIPDNELARIIIRKAGGAVATSSANLSGHSPACTGKQAMAELGGRVAVLLDGGTCSGGSASTIIDCRGDIPFVIREGPISASEFSQAGIKFS